MIGDCPGCDSKDAELFVYISSDMQYCKYCKIDASDLESSLRFNTLEKRLIEEIRLCANKKEGE